MATRRTTPAPSVVVLTDQDLREFVRGVHEQFNQIKAKLDAIEDKLSKPGLETAKLRKDLAALAVESATKNVQIRRVTPRPVGATTRTRKTTSK